MQVSGKLHADDCIPQGFRFRSVLAEFGRLRATVLRLYEESGGGKSVLGAPLQRAVDEALTLSMDRFAMTAS